MNNKEYYFHIKDIHENDIYSLVLSAVALKKLLKIPSYGDIAHLLFSNTAVQVPSFQQDTEKQRNAGCDITAFQVSPATLRYSWLRGLEVTFAMLSSTLTTLLLE